MARLTFFSMLFFLNIVSSIYGEKIIWSGKVEANGSPTSAIDLVLNHKYQIRVSEFVNLGKWIQNSEKLANDACYEFSAKLPPTKIETLKNSLEISVCDGKYNPDHTYQSVPFVAKQDKIHFWVYDTYYADNTGAFKVQIIQLSDD